MPFIRSSAFKASLVSATLLSIAVFGILRPLYATSLKWAHAPNEGWLAIAVAAWRDGSPLYPGPNEFFVVNYLPLAFLPYRVLEVLFGDMIIAGRWLSWLLILVLCSAVSVIVYQAARRVWPAVVSGCLVLATFSVWYTGNLGIAEPQLLGHVLILISIVILFCSVESKIALLAATALMLAAGLVKPNLFGFPLGLAGWLWWTRPRRFLPWISGCALATVTIVAVLYLYFGADLFLPNVFIGRVYSLHEVLSNLTILNSLAVPLSACLIFFDRLRSTTQGLLMCFVMLASFVELVLTGAARGTAYNTGYDLGLASCIGTGIILARLNDTNERYIRADDLIMFAIVIRIFIGLIPQFSERALSVEARTSLMRENEQVTKIINVLASVKGLVACVHLSFCYWAGKRSRIDLFMQPAVFFRPPRNPANIRRGIESRMFAAVEYIAAAPPELGILANYQPIHVADPSVIDSVVAIPIAPLGAK